MLLGLSSPASLDGRELDLMLLDAYLKGSSCWEKD